MNTTTHNCDLIAEIEQSLQDLCKDAEALKAENKKLKDTLIRCVMALNVAQSALAHCKADVGYSSKQTKAAIEINSAITKYNELVQQ